MRRSEKATVETILALVVGGRGRMAKEEKARVRAAKGGEARRMPVLVGGYLVEKGGGEGKLGRR